MMQNPSKANSPFLFLVFFGKKIQKFLHIIFFHSNQFLGVFWLKKFRILQLKPFFSSKWTTMGKCLVGNTHQVALKSKNFSSWGWRPRELKIQIYFLLNSNQPFRLNKFKRLTNTLHKNSPTSSTLHPEKTF